MTSCSLIWLTARIRRVVSPDSADHYCSVRAPLYTVCCGGAPWPPLSHSQQAGGALVSRQQARLCKNAVNMSTNGDSPMSNLSKNSTGKWFRLVISLPWYSVDVCFTAEWFAHCGHAGVWSLLFFSAATNAWPGHVLYAIYFRHRRTIPPAVGPIAGGVA